MWGVAGLLRGVRTRSYEFARPIRRPPAAVGLPDSHSLFGLSKSPPHISVTCAGYNWTSNLARGLLQLIWVRSSRTFLICRVPLDGFERCRVNGCTALRRSVRRSHSAFACSGRLDTLGLAGNHPARQVGSQSSCVRCVCLRDASLTMITTHTQLTCLSRLPDSRPAVYACTLFRRCGR